MALFPHAISKVYHISGGLKIKEHARKSSKVLALQLCKIGVKMTKAALLCCQEYRDDGIISYFCSGCKTLAN
jgi:hypothetical protein